MEALESVEILLTRHAINEAVDALHHIGNFVSTHESCDLFRQLFILNYIQQARGYASRPNSLCII